MKMRSSRVRSSSRCEISVPSGSGLIVLAHARPRNSARRLEAASLTRAVGALAPAAAGPVPVRVRVPLCGRRLGYRCGASAVATQ